jgi:hypothetical protein
MPKVLKEDTMTLKQQGAAILKAKAKAAVQGHVPGSSGSSGSKSVALGGKDKDARTVSHGQEMRSCSLHGDPYQQSTFL